MKGFDLSQEDAQLRNKYTGKQLASEKWLLEWCVRAFFLVLCNNLMSEWLQVSNCLRNGSDKTY